MLDSCLNRAILSGAVTGGTVTLDAGTVAEELESYGLTPSRRLCKNLANPAFLEFAEGAARSFSENKKNLSSLK